MAKNSPNRNFDISLVIPLYNEELNAGNVTRRLEVLTHGNMSYQIVLVDNGTLDRTSEVIDSLITWCSGGGAYFSMFLDPSPIGNRSGLESGF